MTLRDLFLRVRALVAPRRVERELDEELAFHLERETQKHLADGLSPADARTQALARFGSVLLAADQCRDARGTAFVDTLVRDILYAFRTFRRAPLTALTIVATVALGLGLITVVFTIYDIAFLRRDAVRSPHELFAVERPAAPGTDEQLPFTQSDYEAIRSETSVFTDAFAMLRAVRTRSEGRPLIGALVTGNFFQVLGVRAVLGRPLTPDDDERAAGRPVIVLSHRGWNKLFAGDPLVVGRNLRVNGLPYEIVGVMPDGFRGLGIGPPDYWAPLALAGRFRDHYAGRPDEIPVDVVGRLKPGVSPESATAALTVWASGRIDLETIPGRPAAIRLRPRQGTSPDDAREALLVFSPIFFAFGLILMIGCANVANLQLARGVSRQREIGIRLSLGASRRRIIRQLLTESLLLALAAAACGLAASRLFLEGAVYAAATTMPPELADQLSIGAPAADWRVLVFLVAGAVVSTLFFGLVPALQATRLELVRTMRGEVTKDARPGRARHALIAVQVGASALLLICAAIFLRGALAAATVNPGVRTSDTLMVFIVNEARRAALLQAVMTHPRVTAVAASSQRTLAVAETSSRAPVDLIAVSPEYFTVLDIDVIRGRGFTQAERTAESGVAVVTETVARRFWPNRDAVGQVVRLQAQRSDSAAAPLSSADTRGAKAEPSRAYTVVGVVRDVGGPLASDFFPSSGVYVPTGPESPGTSLTLRVRGDLEQTRQALLEDLTRVDPGLGQINSMRTLAGMQAYILRIAFWVAVVLGGLALVLTVSGLFSVLSYIVEQRAKDIGVRMALGATTSNVAGLVLSQSLRPVGIGLAAGGGLAAALAIVLMATPAASEIGRLVHVFDPVAYAASLLVIVTSCVLAASVPAWRAAHVDPIATLRKD
ncbi:MAG TPA: ABC transporter permease [Vicinamibacterales bacterium]|nr:ABC transporter permease [Vicinamibacterales bacterium]